jgi:hypothetical protein
MNSKNIKMVPWLKSKDTTGETYNIWEPLTGREIANNLEIDEAVLIENARELYLLAQQTKNHLEHYYMADRDNDLLVRQEINEHLTQLEILLTEIHIS